MKMKKREYARHRGCSDTAVRKAILEGRISADAHGLIDVELADKAWPREGAEVRTRGANLDANPVRSSQEVRSAENASLVRQVLAEEGQDIGDDHLTLNHVRMAVGILKAHEQRVANAQAERQLLPRDDVFIGMTDTFARIRSKLLALPTRAAPVLMTLDDAAQVQEALRKIVYEILNELANTVVVGITAEEVAMAAQAEEE